jgi:sec-independent protein translocase protein TatA
MPIYAIGGLGPGELVLVLVIVLLIFGASRLPQIGEGLGKAVRNLKRGLSTDDDIEVTAKDKQVAARSSAKSATEEVTEAEVVERKS